MKPFTLSVIVILLFFQSLSYGQRIDKSVALAPIYYANNTASKNLANILHNYVLNAMNNSLRFDVVARGFAQTEIMKEKELTRSSEFIDGKVAKEGKQIGAEYIIVVKVNMANAIPVKKSKTNELLGYQGRLSLFVNVVDVKRGTRLYSEIITPKGVVEALDYNNDDTELFVKGLFGKKVYDTPELALEYSVESIEPHIRAYIDKAFPLEMRITDIQPALNSKKKNGMDILIVGGKATGLKEKDVLIVKEIHLREVQGITGKKLVDEVEIGKLKVDRVGDDLVVCKITNNKDKIINTFKEKPKMLKIVYVKKKFL